MSWKSNEQLTLCEMKPDKQLTPEEQEQRNQEFLRMLDEEMPEILADLGMDGPVEDKKDKKPRP